MISIQCDIGLNFSNREYLYPSKSGRGEGGPYVKMIDLKQGKLITSTVQIKRIKQI